MRLTDRSVSRLVMPDSAVSFSVPALDRILCAAERLFAERGFDSVAISDVAREAGVCKANVFHHFAGKQALYETVLTESCARLGEEMQRTLAADADPAERVAHFLHWYRRYLREHPATARLLLRELTGNPDLAESGPVFPVLTRLLDYVVAHVDAGREAGVFRARVNPTIVASLLLGVTLFNSQTEHLRAHMRAWQDVGDDAYVDLLTDVLMHGVMSSQSAQPA
jgi:TetR/AcrR family transcriptional regulator